MQLRELYDAGFSRNPATMLRKCVWYIAHVAVNGTVPLATRDASRDT